MGKLIMVKLNTDVPEGSFDCGNNSINSEIQQSYFPTLLQYAYAYQVISLDLKRVVGYYMIRFKTINLEVAPEEISEYECSLIRSCAALHVQYLAVDKSVQHKQIGTNVLKTIIMQGLKLSKQIPICMITLDALKEKYQWYIDRGFKPFNKNDLQNLSATIPMYVNCRVNKEAIDKYCAI